MTVMFVYQGTEKRFFSRTWR